MIRFTVYGIPQTAGSKRAFPFKKRDGKLGVAVSDDNPKSRDWKNQVADAARLAVGEDALRDGPLKVFFDFYLPRPKGHFRWSNNEGRLRESAPTFHTKRPDALKLARAAEDALKGVVYRDDSQICDERLQKLYGEPARLEVSIWPL